MANQVMLQVPQQQHEEANLISWDDSVCLQNPPTPTASAKTDCSRAVPVQQQQQRTDQHQQRMGSTQQQPQLLQLSKEAHERCGAVTCPASRQAAYSSSSKASDSYEAALALVPKVPTHHALS